MMQPTVMVNLAWRNVMTEYFAIFGSGILVISIFGFAINLEQKGQKYTDELQEKHQIEIKKCEVKGGQAVTSIREPHYGLFVEELQACIKP